MSTPAARTWEQWLEYVDDVLEGMDTFLRNPDNWPSIRKHLLRGASARRVFKQCRPDPFAQIFAAESAVESDSTRDFGKSSRVRLRPSRRQKRSEG